MSVKVQFDTFDDGHENIKYLNNSFIFEYPCKKIDYCKPYKVTLSHGLYRIELWGAQGGDARQLNDKTKDLPNKGGRGAYTHGHLYIKDKIQLYIYLGAKGEDQFSLDYGIVSKGGWNFGGDGGVDKLDQNVPESGAGGGGGVDIRLIPVDTKTTDKNLLDRSILSRIMCAGSGGGAVSENTSNTIISEDHYPVGSPGGGLSSNSYYSLTVGGTQTLGELGIGKPGYSSSDFSGCSTGGAGSGYRGGYHLITTPAQRYITHAGPGGSSYISGYKGCISPLGGNEFHHSSIYFTNAFMLNGSEMMPQPDFSYSIGHSGHGAARITIIHEICATNIVYYTQCRLIFYEIFILIYDDS